MRGATMTSDTKQAGRITVLFAFLMVGISLYLGLSLNLSRLLQERAHLQICADAAAFSGAVQQSRGLNRIARMNNQAVTVLKTTSLALKCYIFPNHDAGSRTALAAALTYRLYNLVNLARQEKTNIDAAHCARDTVREIAARNAPEAKLTSYTPVSSGLGRLIPGTGTERKFGFFYKQATPLGELVLYDPGQSVKAMVLKKAFALDTIYYSAQVRKPRTTWLFNWGRPCLGGAENLRTYATAKPGAGALWDGSSARPEYAAALVRTGAVLPRPSIPDDWGYDW